MRANREKARRMAAQMTCVRRSMKKAFSCWPKGVLSISIERLSLLISRSCSDDDAGFLGIIHKIWCKDTIFFSSMQAKTHILCVIVHFFVIFWQKKVFFVCVYAKIVVLLRANLCRMAECEQKSVSSACRGCALSDRCKVVEDDRYSRAQRWKALLLAYILPFVLLAGVIVLTDWLTDNEYIIGGAALATVAIYYLIFFIQKPKI